MYQVPSPFASGELRRPDRRNGKDGMRCRWKKWRLITRLDNALENLAGSLQAEQNSLEETKTQLENARTELAAPFAREEELAEKTARLKELNILLNMDEKDKTLLDDTPDEGEDVPARGVAGLARARRVRRPTKKLITSSRKKCSRNSNCAGIGWFPSSRLRFLTTPTSTRCGRTF